MTQLQPTLVFTRKAGGSFGDSPDDVSKILDGPKPNLVYVVYSLSGKSYMYKRENVAVLSLTKAVDPSQAVIRHGNTIQKNVQLCGFYSSNHPAKENLCLIQFENGKTRFLKAKDVSVHPRGNDSFLLYLREVCNQTEEEIPYPDGRRGKYQLNGMKRDGRFTGVEIDTAQRRVSVPQSRAPRRREDMFEEFALGVLAGDL